MVEVTQHIIDEMVNVIVQTVDPEQIILFGSRVKNNERLDSFTCPVIL